MKPRIFIGSSSEGIESAKKVTQLLAEKIECDIVLWNDGETFGIGVSYLDSLLKAGSMFDFGIFVATKDDLIVSRELKSKSPRDNVIFELGLFMGGLGKFRSLLLLENETKLPSDFNGISISKFKRGLKPEHPDSIEAQVKAIAKHIEDKFKQPQLGLLASTSIAMGFYNNFVERICNYFRNNNEVVINNKLYHSFEVQVVMPNKLQHEMQKSADFYFQQNQFAKHSFKAADGRDIWSRITESKSEPGKLLICDIPTTLSSLYDSIVIYLGANATDDSKEFQLIESREMNNFIEVILSKINRDPLSKKVVKFIHYDF